MLIMRKRLGNGFSEKQVVMTQRELTAVAIEGGVWWRRYNGPACLCS